MPSTQQQQEQALLGSERITTALGAPLLGAFLAVRQSDAQWAAEQPLEEIISAHLWRY
jgi:glutamine synthetase